MVERVGEREAWECFFFKGGLQRRAEQRVRDLGTGDPKKKRGK
jgi:hypothetical protein